MVIIAQHFAFGLGTASALVPGTKREKTETKITTVTPVRNAPRMTPTPYYVIARFSKQFPAPARFGPGLITSLTVKRRPNDSTHAAVPFAVRHDSHPGFFYGIAIRR